MTFFNRIGTSAISKEDWAQCHTTLPVLYSACGQDRKVRGPDIRMVISSDPFSFWHFLESLIYLLIISFSQETKAKSHMLLLWPNIGICALQ